MGGNSGDFTEIGHCERYDMTEDIWEPCPRLTEPINSPTVVQINDRYLFAFNGQRLDNEDFCNFALRLDTFKPDEWHQVPLPVPNILHS